VNGWHLLNKELKEPLPYPDCGLDDVYLLNGYDVENTPYGDGIVVQDVDGLRAAIARDLVSRKKVLNGKEIRFLRKQMDLTQSELGRLVGLDAQSVARWEKGQRVQKKGPAELLLRVIYTGTFEGKIDPLAILRRLDELDAPIRERRVFKETNDGWRAAL
jgi:DNA-binding transcriptional regulator YiaG